MAAPLAMLGAGGGRSGPGCPGAGVIAGFMLGGVATLNSLEGEPSGLGMIRGPDDDPMIKFRYFSTPPNPAKSPASWRAEASPMTAVSRGTPAKGRAIFQTPEFLANHIEQPRSRRGKTAWQTAMDQMATPLACCFEIR